MTNQIWKPIHGYQGFYDVSDHGRVRSVDRVLNLRAGKTRKIKGKVLKPKCTRDGYIFVSLSKDGICKTAYIHRLVAEAFLPNPEGYPEVNHISGCKDCNSVTDLEWVTHQQNVQHAYDSGLTNNMGGNHRLAAGVVDNQLGQSFDTIQDWCQARGIAYSTGRNLLNNQGKSRRIDLSSIVKVRKTND